MEIELINTLNIIKVCAALRDPLSTNFVKTVLKQHYEKIFSKKIADHFIDPIFATLIASQKEKISVKELKESIKKILESNLFEIEDNIFDKKYSHYKKIEKPKYYFEKIKNDISGNKILDFGCGKGFNAKYLIKQGYQVIGTDVIDYVETKSFKFVLLKKIKDILNFSKVDTTIILTVLHHINEDNIKTVLLNLSKITKKLIIIEDVYDLESFSKTNIHLDKQSKILSTLPEKSKLNSIILTDFYGNIISQGLTEMNLPFEFKKTSEWVEILNSSGFKNIKTEFIGFPTTSFHGFSQVKITCDSKSNLISIIYKNIQKIFK